jgi:hypothetical protein
MEGVMHERSISPSWGFTFYAHRSVVEQGVAMVEETIRGAAPDTDLSGVDPVAVTLHAQAHALWVADIAGTA